MSSRKAREKASALSNANVAATPALSTAAIRDREKDKGAPPDEGAQNREVVPGKMTEREW